MTDVRATCGDAGGVTLAGDPCKGFLNLSVEGLCLQHDPDRAAEGLRVVQSGGHASAVARRARLVADPEDCPPQPRTLEDATDYAAWLTHAITVGRLDPRVGQSAAFCLQRFMSLADKRDLQKQVTSLTAALAKVER